MDQDRLVVTVTRRRSSKTALITVQAIHGHTGKVIQSYASHPPCSESFPGVLSAELAGYLLVAAADAVSKAELQGWEDVQLPF